MRIRYVLPGAAWVLAALLWAAPAAGQFLTNGQITGEVTASGLPLSGALVTLSSVRGGSARTTTTTALGTFRFDFVLPGSYEVRAESPGYRPLVARTVAIEAGSVRDLTLSLLPGQPPVTEVDTLALTGSWAASISTGGIRLGSVDLHELPIRSRDLAGVAALSSLFDASLGSLGLPGDLSLTYVDGVPLYRAPHPTARSEQAPHALFTTSTLSAVGVVHHASDIEWAGAAGGYTTLSTRAWDGGPPQAWAAYSGDATWQSAELDFTPPSLLSFEAGARGGFASSESSRLSVSADALRHQTPLAPRVPSSPASDLGGLDADVLAGLTEPAVESFARYSGSARLDSEIAATTRLFLRAGGSLTERDFEGAGPVASPGGATMPERSIDWSAAGVLVNERSSNVSLEVRAGVSGSSRDFAPAVDDRIPTLLTETGAVLGSLVAAAGESSRTDVSLVPVLRIRQDLGTLKIGASARMSRHTMAHSDASAGTLLFSDAAALLAGDGRARLSASPEASFSTNEIGLFTQLDRRIGPELDVSIGARWDYEMLPTGDATQSAALLSATGLDNTLAPSGLHQFGLRGRLEWDPTGQGSTKVTLLGSMHEGDLDTRALYQLLSQDAGATDTRFDVTGVAWPVAGALAAPPTGATSTTVLGPDTRAPRTVVASVGVAQDLGSGIALHVQATRRTTDFLMRRRNLNLSVTPMAVDPDGREIFGALEKDGALIHSIDDTARRFGELGDVWALDPDGWSEYKGITLGFERSGAQWNAYASYTRSETTDNWVGARQGLVDAMLAPRLPPTDGQEPWSEGLSDFDAPHRVAAGTTLRMGNVSLSGAYTFRSGYPFTPRYRDGVDANGDGSSRNDVAFVPGDTQLAVLLDAWPCLEDQAASFADRNSCRGASRHTLNLGIEVDIGSRLSLRIEGLDLVEHSDGYMDEALLLVDPTMALTTSPDGSTVTTPTSVNPDFGSVLYPSSRGRMVRFGLRIGT